MCHPTTNNKQNNAIMNNEQFRKLLGSTPTNPQNGNSSTPRASATAGASLGSRNKSFIPMTPRSVLNRGGVDFARQLAERNAGPEKSKRFRSAAPKGSRLAEGYQDRTQERIDEENDDKARRIKALEDALKLEQIDEATFVRLRDEIAGGDISTTHLVKGLDFKLLKRIREGENVLEGSKKAEEKEEEAEDLDAQFEELEKQEVVPVAKQEKVKQGVMAPPPPVAGQKRTRDQILAELKASRTAEAEARAAALPQLGAKFKKIGVRQETSRIERDQNGRDVLITTDADGNVKRKVRKVKDDENKAALTPLLELDPAQKPLGMDVPAIPEAPVAPEDSEDDDIFEGAGHDFNPLAALADDDDDSSSDEEGEEKESAREGPLDGRETPKRRLKSRSRSLSRSHSRSRSESVDSEGVASEPETIPQETAAPVTAAPRNYFNEPSLSVLGNMHNPLKDPALLAALANSRKLDPERMSSDANPPSSEEAARLKRRAAMISNQDRDLEDMDMGFGSSRFDDAEDMANEGERVKFSKWKGLGDDGEDDDDEEGGKKKKGEKRKRAPKKRKGDKDSAADVLSVMKSNKAKKEGAMKPIG
jgi:hypothetical protein